MNTDITSSAEADYRRRSAAGEALQSYSKPSSWPGRPSDPPSKRWLLTNISLQWWRHDSCQSALYKGGAERLTVGEFDPWGHIDTRTRARTHVALWFILLSAFISKYKVAEGETWVMFKTAVEQFTLSHNIVLLCQRKDKLQNMLKKIVWRVGKCAYCLSCQELDSTRMCAQEKWRYSRLTVSLALHKDS